MTAKELAYGIVGLFILLVAAYFCILYVQQMTSGALKLLGM